VTSPGQPARSQPPGDPGPGPEAVASPPHPVHALTTYELRDYRRQLERALACFDTRDPVPPVRDQLRARLDAVLAEQDDRVRLARA
jgi:hypothetical protein